MGSLVKLMNHEKVEIKPWHGGYNEKPIDFGDPIQVSEWCSHLHKYKLNLDTGDVLYRWNIAIYQIITLQENIVEPRDWSEAVASCLIHATASFENCGIDCYQFMYLKPFKVDEEKDKCLERLMFYVPHITRQVLYYAMKRKNRFDEYKLCSFAGNFIREIIEINYAGRMHLPIQEGLMLAMNKLAYNEIKTH